MKILIAPDKFKRTFSASEIAEIISQNLSPMFPIELIETVPLSDGGEGFVEILTNALSGTIVQTNVFNPIFKNIKANYGLSCDNAYAYIEMAQASGINLLPIACRNPSKTSTYGTGQLILDALRKKATNVVIGLGGSATNDGGIGMANALGYRFIDKSGDELVPIGENLNRIEYIDCSGVESSVFQTFFSVVTDVTNPLHGKNGAAYVFASQKGANAEQIQKLDEGLQHFADVVKKQFLVDIRNFEGAGAAGGLAAGAKFFLNAKISKGFDYVAQAVNLEQKIQDADLIFSGEGKLDEQSLNGKVISGVINLARKYQKKIVIICGISEITEQTIDYSNCSIYSLFTKPVKLDFAKKKTPDRLKHLFQNIKLI